MSYQELANAFAANPDPAAAGSALCAHCSSGVRNAGLPREDTLYETARVAPIPH
jgi:hypothetical protein